MASSSEQVQVYKNAMLTPIATVDEAVRMLDTFMEFKQKLLKSDDIQTFKVKVKNSTGGYDYVDKEFCKKSGCQKLALVFFISCDIVHEQVEHIDGTIVARVWAKAIHTPSGRYFTAVGACSSQEKMQDVWEKDATTGKSIKTGERKLFNEARIEHDVVTHAQTRASNRAILSVLGSGEISAEEMESEGGDTHSSHKPSSKPEQASKMVCSDKSGTHVHNTQEKWCDTNRCPLVI